MDYIDLRSDTVTWPTDQMRKAMADARVGDDVYGDDPTVIELEALAAHLTGKEAALLVPSGTFGNQLALFTHCPRGSEVILDENCHIVQHEAGGASVIAGVQLRTVATKHGCLSAEDVASRIRGTDIHYPPTSLVCLENAHSNGRVFSLEEMDKASGAARSAGVPVHLDGARLFNAATALGVPAADIARRADSVMFCLSKGLCAPVGSMLAGSREFIDKARGKRKIMGGGMRQAGVIAAAGLVALGPMRERLAEDHTHAKALAAGLAKLPGVVVDTDAVDIDMVYLSMNPAPDPDKFVAYMRSKGILANPPEGGKLRFVCHYWIRDEHLPLILEAMSTLPV
ncbi:MAG: GntG family PLP-dependent aldolase [Spirochaetia bacterium]|jgi:threonine aldolase|nr:GntG family PLP-dependent aldolase [Spirochaetia bacterium]